MPRSPEELLALATKFQLTDDISIQARGKGLWAVCTSSGCCINTFFEREVEPFPSNRDKEFLARTRLSLEEAFDRADAYLALPPEYH